MDNIAVESAVYTPKDIQEILRISRTAAYALIAKAPFRVIKIGKVYRIPKQKFDNWLKQQD